MDEEAERDVQPVRLADAAPRPPGGADHRQHHGPAGEDHDQQSGQQTGEGVQPVTSSGGAGKHSALIFKSNKHTQMWNFCLQRANDVSI